MADNDKTYHRSFTASVGAGMGSVFRPGGRKYFILEHKVSSKFHKAGESQEIIVDNIELGRDPRCQVRFDDSFSTVSRRHAAIIKEGDGWKLVQLSNTNTTLLNGKPVHKEWYLQNGDEIQLSVNGPRLGFIVPSGNKSTVGSIGLSRRLSLFRQQALRPYKTAIVALTVLLVLLAGVGGWFLFGLNKENTRLAHKTKTQGEQIHKQNQRLDSLNNVNLALINDAAEKEATISEMQNQIADLKNRPPQVINQGGNFSVSAVRFDNDVINRAVPSVYYIQALGYDITFDDGTQTSIACGRDADELSPYSGTGFLLADGRFVTARHVAQPWLYFFNGGEIDEDMLYLNAIANNGGKVVVYLLAVSSNGDRITLTSDQCFTNSAQDERIALDDGTCVVAATLGPTDFAVFNTGKSGGLKYNYNLSTNLERGTQLTVLGFPLGLGANSVSDINPIYGTVVVSTNGLQDGVILSTDTNYETGNSGGPVMAFNSSTGELEVVGIVSATAGKNTGFIVPISSIKR